MDGPSGVGKSLLAREMARTILCASPAEGPDACGGCRSCGLFERSANPDLAWVEAEEGKKGISVAQIRELRGRVELPPHGGAARAVVIDDADSMSAEAQNALLKTLEEPPSRTFLILTTSRAHNLLPTVRSRCARLRLSPLADDVVLDLLSSERPEASTVAARIAATVAQGSVTRALGLLDADLDDLMGLVERVNEAVEARSTLDALGLAEEIAGSRETMVTALELIALWYRDVLGTAAAGGEHRAAFEGRQGALGRCAESMGITGASARVETVLEAIRNVTVRNANARLTAESMLLRMLS